MSSTSSHKSKSDSAWAQDIAELVRSGAKTLGRGQAPKNGTWKREYDKIRACPKQGRESSGRRQQPTLGSFIVGAAGGGGTLQCSCGWHDDAPNPSPLRRFL